MFQVAQQKINIRYQMANVSVKMTDQAQNCIIFELLIKNKQTFVYFLEVNSDVNLKSKMYLSKNQNVNRLIEKIPQKSNI